MSKQLREPRLVLGRNYVETLVLTFEQFQLFMPTLDVAEYIVKRLEETLCSIAYTLPYIKNVYHNKIMTILGEMFPDLPRPDFKSCFAYDTLVNWMKNNKNDIMKMSEMGLIPFEEMENKIKEMTIHIIRTAVISTLIETGIISIT